jgi:hypothetical protein
MGFESSQWQSMIRRRRLLGQALRSGLARRSRKSIRVESNHRISRPVYEVAMLPKTGIYDALEPKLNAGEVGHKFVSRGRFSGIPRSRFADGFRYRGDGLPATVSRSARPISGSGLFPSATRSSLLLTGDTGLTG